MLPSPFGFQTRTPGKIGRATALPTCDNPLVGKRKRHGHEHVQERHAQHGSRLQHQHNAEEAEKGSRWCRVFVTT